MKAKASRETIYQWVSDILKREFELTDAELSLSADLIDDLDLDSIDAIDLSVRLEEKTGLSFKEQDLKSIRTLQDVVDFIDARLD
jgi:acyl carrier protein